MLLHGCGTFEPAPPVTRAAGAGPELPAKAGRVVDEANVLTPVQAQALSRRLAEAEATTHHQVVVVTVCGFDGETIGGYSRWLANAWGIGRAFYNDGVLFLVAPVQRQVRIEVGFGLENALTDTEAAMIIDRDVIPRFRAENWNGGIDAAVTSILREIS
ncbi:TPM domain-containing protein [Sphingomonas pituitosa]|uniref:TPM domain-containing protein n=1 Tax=Sphingomonas pituitosa TaxID=99597 RepID=UPI00082D7577|nr:TPM domain-containing protein [Sphingomonas pituitosa]